MTRTRARTAALLVVALAGCQPPERRQQDPARQAAPDAPVVAPVTPNGQGADEDAHHVVFADRLAYSYVLLLAPETPEDFTAPTRAQLKELITRAYPGHERDEEVRLLQLLAERDLEAQSDGPPELALPDDDDDDDAPPSSALGSGDGSGDGSRDGSGEEADEDAAAVAAAVAATDDPDKALRLAGRTADLVGLSLEQVRAESEGGETFGLIPTRFLFEDAGAPLLTRALDSEERQSLARRRWQLVVRVGYRNRNAVRGLRLLQALVRVLAREHDALIYDPDTHETVDLETFTRRRLQVKLGNIADQIVVVPFADHRHGDGFIRLTTRGMRRFGSVDIELDGLARDPWLLQQATHFLYGLAFQMVTLGVLGESGFATELDDTVTVHYRDCAQAYAGREQSLPRCESCPESVLVHLVERPAEDHDPTGHVVARVVAPRSTSDRPDYDQSAWARSAVERVLGPAPAQPDAP